ncbi:MAG: 4Fe-4S dicluster domain-containing protein [Candidatus Dormibacteria bacterium]
MTYVITEACIDVKDKSCIDVCPVDCIHEVDEDRMVYIDPEECIDCGACVDPCPVEAIYAEDELPEDKAQYIALNADYFKDAAGVRAKIDALKPREA